MEQIGFRPGFGTKALEYNIPLVLTFVDFDKAFDTFKFTAVFLTLLQCVFLFQIALDKTDAEKLTTGGWESWAKYQHDDIKTYDQSYSQF